MNNSDPQQTNVISFNEEMDGVERGIRGEVGTKRRKYDN